MLCYLLLYLMGVHVFYSFLKVQSLVADCAPNMMACTNALQLRHITCFAHVLNLVVKRSLAQSPELEQIRSRGRRIVGHFKSSTKEKLSEKQRQMARAQANPGGYCYSIINTS